MAAPAVVWELLRGQNSFVVKRDRTQFSREKGNLANRNSFKYSGLAPKKSVDLTKESNGVALSLKRKQATKQSKPATQYSTVKYNRPFRSVAKTVKKEVDAYRPDLTRAALARLSALNRSARSATVAKKRKNK